MFREYVALYPGTPATAESEFVAKARQICDAGAPATWWDAWPHAQSNADFWNLTIEHLCPEYRENVVTARP